MDTKFEVPDPYLSQYVYAKATNPKFKLVWKQYQKKLVDRVDHIVELAQGNRDVVKSLKDWEIVGELFKFFADEWPAEYQEFRKTIPDIRRSRRAGGYSESRETRYVGALPPRFMRMLKAVFPQQQFDKSFANKLVRKIPLLKVGGENNLSKGATII